MEGDGEHFGGVEGALDEQAGVGGIVDDIDVFVVHLAHHGGDAATLDADAGAYGVDAVVVAFHGYFGAFARDACHAAHGDETVGDFGDFLFEQAAQKFGRGARQVDAGVAVAVVHAVDDGADVVAFVEEVAGYLLAFGQVKLVVLVVHEQGLALPCLIDLGGDEFAHAVFVFVVEGVVFEFEDFAGQGLTECQDGASSELGEVDGLADLLAHFVVGVDFLSG